MWTDEDRALVEAFTEWKAGTCPDCGTRDEWWDPAQGGHRFAFLGETRRCIGCGIKEQERAQIPKDERGIHVHLVPNPALRRHRDGTLYDPTQEAM